jgi:hypothetical protein
MQTCFVVCSSGINRVLPVRLAQLFVVEQVGVELSPLSKQDGVKISLSLGFDDT